MNSPALAMRAQPPARLYSSELAERRIRHARTEVLLDRARDFVSSARVEIDGAPCAHVVTLAMRLSCAVAVFEAARREGAALVPILLELRDSDVLDPPEREARGKAEAFASRGREIQTGLRLLLDALAPTGDPHANNVHESLAVLCAGTGRGASA